MIPNEPTKVAGALHAKRARRLSAAALAVAGGGVLIAAAGYFWIGRIAAALAKSDLSSPWSGYPEGPGVAALIVGSVLVLIALVAVRLKLRPHLAGRLLWGSAWLGWAAFVLHARALYSSAATVAAWQDPIGTFSAFAAPGVVGVAVAMLLTGLCVAGLARPLPGPRLLAIAAGALIGAGYAWVLAFLAIVAFETQSTPDASPGLGWVMWSLAALALGIGTTVLVRRSLPRKPAPLRLLLASAWVGLAGSALAWCGLVGSPPIIGSGALVPGVLAALAACATLGAVAAMMLASLSSEPVGGR